MTTPHKAAMQQALDVLQRASDAGYSIECEAAIAALQAAIDAPDAEPVAWMHPSGGVLRHPATGLERSTHTIPLYLHPPAVREPLTREQKKQMWRNATIEMCSHENCYWRGIADAEAAHGITAPLIQAKHLPADDTEGGAP